MTADRTDITPALRIAIDSVLVTALMRIAINLAAQLAIRDGGDMTEFHAIVARTAEEMTINEPALARLINDGVATPEEIDSLVRAELVDTITTLLSQTEKAVQGHTKPQGSRH